MLLAHCGRFAVHAMSCVQVAVQRLGLDSVSVSPGQELCVRASHDTYSISFSVATKDASPTQAEKSTGEHSTAEQVAVAGDPVLLEARQMAQPLCSAFAKVLAQDPVAARTATTLAMQMAAQAGRAHSHGTALAGGRAASILSVDGAAAAELAAMLCNR